MKVEITNNYYCDECDNEATIIITTNKGARLPLCAECAKELLNLLQNV